MGDDLPAVDLGSESKPVSVKAGKHWVRMSLPQPAVTQRPGLNICKGTMQPPFQIRSRPDWNMLVADADKLWSNLGRKYVLGKIHAEPRQAILVELLL